MGLERGRKHRGSYRSWFGGVPLVLPRQHGGRAEVIPPRDALFAGVRMGIGAGGHGFRVLV